jgi:hypothetical protein
VTQASLALRFVKFMSDNFVGVRFGPDVSKARHGPPIHLLLGWGALQIPPLRYGRDDKFVDMGIL